MKNGPIISLSGIHKRFPMGSVMVNALKDINLTIQQGDFLVIMGPSGSGKSTLMNIIGLLDRPDEGSYLLDDKEVGTLDDAERSFVRNRTFGFIFQNFNLLPRANALRNVLLPLTYRRLSDAERKQMALESLDTVGLAERAAHLPTQLSGGEQQRVATARALVGKPSIILADEPTGNLDSKTGLEIIKLLLDLANNGKAVIMVTHDLSLAEYAHNVVNMLDGYIIK